MQLIKSSKQHNLMPFVVRERNSHEETLNLFYHILDYISQKYPEKSNEILKKIGINKLSSKYLNVENKTWRNLIDFYCRSNADTSFNVDHYLKSEVNRYI